MFPEKDPRLQFFESYSTSIFSFEMVHASGSPRDLVIVHDNYAKCILDKDIAQSQLNCCVCACESRLTTFRNVDVSVCVCVYV